MSPGSLIAAPLRLRAGSVRVNDIPLPDSSLAVAGCSVYVISRAGVSPALGHRAGPLVGGSWLYLTLSRWHAGSSLVAQAACVAVFGLSCRWELSVATGSLGPPPDWLKDAPILAAPSW